MYKKILESFVKPSRRRYSPEFRVTTDANGWRLSDGDQPVAFFGKEFYFDIWQFSPFEPPEMANVEPAGKVRDLHTLHNTFINLPLIRHRAGDLCEGDPEAAPPARWRWEKRSGKELHVSLSRRFPAGERLRYDVRVVYDPQWARYRYFFDATAWKLTSGGMEPINMMLGGALASRPEKRRWTHSVWVDPDGKLKRLVHSNALFEATDYADPLWRTKNAPQRGAWVAYAAHPSFNPAMLIHETNVPICFATCSQLFDEHLIWQQAGLDQLDDGFFCFRMRTELVNLRPAMARTMLNQAADPPRPRKWQTQRVALPFHMDAVNSFEEAVDPWQPEECPILVVEKDEKAPIQWVRDAAHSGRHAIRFDGREPHKRLALQTCGAVCNVDLHTRYRLSVWVKTRGVDRFARAELASYEYTNANVIDNATSPALSGTNDWTKLTVELDSGDEAYLMPGLVLYGKGTAWFDDAMLEKV